MAMTAGTLTSTHFPYIPVRVIVAHWDGDVEALLDTGFDGELILPVSMVMNGKKPIGYDTWFLADGSEIVAPVYIGTVRIGERVLTPIVVTVLGDRPIVGIGLISHFRVILDRGETVTVELDDSTGP